MQVLRLHSSRLLRNGGPALRLRLATNVERKDTYRAIAHLEETTVRSQEVANAPFNRDFVQSTKKGGTGTVNVGL